MNRQGFKSWLRHDPDQTIGLVSAVTAVILAILTMSGFALTSWVLAATAATLIALLGGNVRDRLNARSTAVETRRMADAVTDLSLAVRHLTRTVYKDQDEPYEQVREYISHNPVRKAVFLQYSGTKCSREIDAVLRKGGTEVVVYLQDQETASSHGSDYQAGLIRTSIETLQGWRRNYEGTSELTVYQCDVPMSARAVMIDDRLLCMGWYICGPGSIKHPHDRMDVSGHDIATVIAYRGTEDFDALYKAFRYALVRLERCRRQVELLSKRSHYNRKRQRMISGGLSGRTRQDIPVAVPGPPKILDTSARVPGQKYPRSSSRRQQRPICGKRPRRYLASDCCTATERPDLRPLPPLFPPGATASLGRGQPPGLDPAVPHPACQPDVQRLRAGIRPPQW